MLLFFIIATSDAEKSEVNDTPSRNCPWSIPTPKEARCISAFGFASKLILTLENFKACACVYMENILNTNNVSTIIFFINL